MNFEEPTNLTFSSFLEAVFLEDEGSMIEDN
jgi:hypothetical protein